MKVTIDEYRDLLADLKTLSGEALKKAKARIDGAEVVDADGNAVEVEVIELATAPADAPADDMPEENAVTEATVQRMVADALSKQVNTKERQKPQDDDTQTKAFKLPAEARGYKSKVFTPADHLGADHKAYAFTKWAQWNRFGGDQRGKWLVDNGIITKAQYESGNTAGGALVPDVFIPDLIRLVEEYGVGRQEAQVVPMTRETATFPKRTGGLTASWAGESTADSATSATKSSASFNNVTLTAKKLITLTLVSSELLEDSAISVADFLGTEIVQAFADAEDDALFNGDGTSTYGGIVGVLNFAGSASIATAATANTAFGTLDLDDFHTAIAKLPKYAHANAKWYISQAGFAKSMQRLTSSSNGVTRRETEDGPQMLFEGYPVVIAQKLNSTLTAQTSTPLIAFGDMAKGVLFGDRKSIEIKMSEDRYFDTDQVAVRGIERVDVTCHSFDSTSTAGPLIVLKTPAS